MELVNKGTLLNYIIVAASSTLTCSDLIRIDEIETASRLKGSRRRSFEPEHSVEFMYIGWFGFSFD
jgi:hypothetical protein